MDYNYIIQHSGIGGKTPAEAAGINIIQHSGIGGKTPAEAAGIKIRGHDKWLTLIQNAADAA